MIKSLLLGFAAMAFVGSASAQTLTAKVPQRLAKNSSVSAFGPNLRVKAQAQSAQPATKLWMTPQSSLKAGAKVKGGMKASAREGETNKMWFSYMNTNEVSPMILETNDYFLGNLVPPTYAGGKIDSVMVLFWDQDCMQDIKIWFAPIKYDSEHYMVFPNGLDEVAYSFDVPNSAVQNPIREDGGVSFVPTMIDVPEDYVIPDEGCIMGYSFTFVGDDKEDAPLLLVGTDEMGGGFYYISDDLNSDGQPDGWYTTYESGYGNVNISALIDVTGLTSSTVSLSSLTETTGRLNTPTTITGILRNDGFSTVENISYVISVNGEAAQPEQTITLTEPIAALSTGMAAFPVTPTFDGENNVSVEITKVNGEANTSSTKSAEGIVLGIEKPYQRTSVVEGFVGTWDGSTPIAYKGFEKLAQDYGNNFIPILAHFYTSDGDNVYPDPMQCDDYVDVANTFGASIPLAFYDRMFSGDPYAGIAYSNDGEHYIYGASQSVDLISQNYPSEAKIELDAYFTNGAKTAINAEVSTTFATNRLDAPYAVGFVLTQDGMTGTADQWKQSNYFSDEYSKYYEEQTGQPFTALNPYKVDDMADWMSKGMLVDMTYDDVVVGAWEPVYGFENSVAAPVIAGRSQFWQQTLDLSSKSLIQNTDNLELTALLINTNTGSIVNATRISLGSGTGIDGVQNAADSAVEVARYNVNGVKLDAPQKGLNIIKYSDGTVKKVIVK